MLAGLVRSLEPIGTDARVHPAIRNTGGTMAKTTIEQVRMYLPELTAKFGSDAHIGYSNVSLTQLSIARHYGGAKVHGRHYVYNEADDSLIREDVAKFVADLEKEREAQAKPAATQEQQQPLFQSETE